MLEEETHSMKKKEDEESEQNMQMLTIMQEMKVEISQQQGLIEKFETEKDECRPRSGKTSDKGVITKHDLTGSSLVDVCGILLPKRSMSSSHSNNFEIDTKFIPTSTSMVNMKSLALAICQGNPILLEGTTGSGKTSLVDELARITSNTPTLIKIHLGDQADAKILLGTYVCTSVPGEFRFQAGALTQAVTEGRWMLIEDIDLAPIEVLSVLIPLLETRTLFLPGRGEVLEAANGFQLFATQTLTPSGSVARDQGHQRVLSHLWTRVVVEPLSAHEMDTVLRSSFPEISHLVPLFLDTFHHLVRVINPASHIGDINDPIDVEDRISSSASSSRFFSSRDLIKWVKRVHRLMKSAKALPASKQHITAAMREIVFSEAVDCFCGMIPSIVIRKKLIHVIGKAWDIPLDRVTFYCDMHKPTLTLSTRSVTIGRVSLPVLADTENLINVPDASRSNEGVFAHTRHALLLMERIAVSVFLNEPILLNGETGTGKTSVVQHLANRLGQTLVVLNLNQQSDSADLLGGFKPIEMRQLCSSLKVRFEKLFKKTLSKQSNRDFIDKVRAAYSNQKWSEFLKLLTRIVKLVDSKKVASGTMQPKLREQWRAFSGEVAKLNTQNSKGKKRKSDSQPFAFSFVEGALVQAVVQGHWVLLDEVNLATAETLERLSGLFEGGSLTLTERGDIIPVIRHSNFRVFACMNPPTDIGKKDLPPGLRSRFTEFFVDEVESREDLSTIVAAYLKEMGMPQPPVDDVVDLFLEAKKEAAVRLSDGANQRPHFSLRTLARALGYAKTIVTSYGFVRSLFEGVSMSFLTQLNRQSYPIMLQLIRKHILKSIKGAQTALPKAFTVPPANPGPGKSWIKFEGFCIETGDQPPVEPGHFIITDTVRHHLNSLARVLVTRKHPILLQGPTSSGKTSMVEYMAIRTGHRFVRINNHEHTDLQEYLGSYISDEEGKLFFQEGILVEAVRKGYWVVLDELNLAPSEVLEALNRLLDDNRELFLPETQETIKAHPHFMLFATQNPPGLCGGRKVLSRAFRNRFLEIHVDDIPEAELEQILSQRCSLPPSYCAKLVAVMKELQLNRQGSNQVFAGKHGFITLRDLFRWAERHPSSYDELAQEGYMLLAERLRREEDKVYLQGVLEKHMKVKIDPRSMYARCTESDEFKSFMAIAATESLPPGLEGLVWTSSMKRLFTLVSRCLNHKEPVLLVGETGCSKTTICQVFALLRKIRLHILNCHANTETADFLGGLRPVRGKDTIYAELVESVERFVKEAAARGVQSATSTKQVEGIKQVIERHNEVLNEITASHPAVLEQLRPIVATIAHLHGQYSKLFSWYDGPLVQAMKSGDYFLIDEISLAEDAVLERLNSVLEPSRMLTLAKKGSVEIEELKATESFRIMATMNPGGDFGKKELSPAMRNRFTEIWVPAITDRADLTLIIEEKFAAFAALQGFSGPILDFLDHFTRTFKIHKTVSLRDILAWVTFMTANLNLAPEIVCIHGACLVLLDGIGVNGVGLGEKEGQKIRHLSIDKLIELLPSETMKVSARSDSLIRANIASSTTDGPVSLPVFNSSSHFGIHPFLIEKGGIETPRLNFALEAPTTSMNVMKVMRGMQLNKSVLLEGSPGVGKSSLVNAIALASGHRMVRINLSEQTDMMDLLGSDLPVEGGTGGSFEWRDGVFLQALKQGDWVLLDELNLASQSVLEGLNGILDHRGTVFIPELSREFACHPSFRVFGAQNPTHQGGGRKGLPKSFLNRFTQVYVDKLEYHDLLFIAGTMYPSIDPSTLEKMITFNSVLYNETTVLGKYARKGSPWEFNLRDVFRWCDLVVSPTIVDSNQSAAVSDPSHFVDLIYLQRMRTKEDRDHIVRLYERIFDQQLDVDNLPFYHITPDSVQVGRSFLGRNLGHPDSLHAQGRRRDYQIEVLQRFLNPMESLMTCVKMGWLAILIGATASGKTSIVRLLAQLTGAQLHEFAMNSSVDTTELLGGFEQIDLVRHRRRIVDQFAELVQFVSQQLISSTMDKTRKSKSASNATSIAHVTAAQDLLNLWTLFLSRTKFAASSTSVSDSISENADGEEGSKGGAFDKEQYQMLGQLLDQVQRLVDAKSPLLDRPNIDTINSQLIKLKQVERYSVTGCFEWIDGLLIQALENGDWILIDNVNFCNATVLDRLNALLEPGGTLMVNERGMIDGQIKVVTPHRDFRIFFAMDEKNGEISRAMRNRGIEICLGVGTDQSVESRDTQALLAQMGIPGKSLANTMVQFHHEVTNRFRASSDTPLTLRHLLIWSHLTIDLLQRGQSSLHAALRTSMEQVYLRSRRLSSHREATSILFAKFFESRKSSFFDDSAMIVRPGLWPDLITGPQLVRNSSLATVRIQGSVLFTSNELTRVQSEIKHAAMYFLEVTSATDFQQHLRWIRTWLKDSRFGNDVLSHVIETVFGGPLAQGLLTYSKAMFPWMTYRPIDLRSNEPLFSLIQSRNDSTSEYLVVAELFRIAICRTIQERVEASVYGSFSAANTLTPSSAKLLSCIVQSYAFHIGKMARDDLLHPHVALLHPFFVALDEVLDIVVDYRCKFVPEDIARIEEIIDLRNSFWRSLNVAGESAMSDFIVRWKWVTKTLAKMPVIDKDKKKDHHLMNIVDSINQAVLGSSKRDTNALWKQAGHPQVMWSDSLVRLEASLRPFNDRLELNSTVTNWREHSSRSMDPEFKRTLIEGYATLHFANIRHSNISQDDSVVVQSLQSIPALLQSKIDIATKSESADTISEELNESSNSLHVRHSHEGLWLVYDHHSLLLEADILSVLSTLRFVELAEADADLTAVPEVRAALLELMPKLRTFIEFSISRSSRAPIDLMPYQQMLWVADSILSTSSDARLTVFEMHDMVWRMLTGWYTCIWSATFNDTEVLSKSVADVTTDSVSSGRLTAGSSQLASMSLRSVVVDSVVSDVKSVPLFCVSKDRPVEAAVSTPVIQSRPAVRRIER